MGDVIFQSDEMLGLVPDSPTEIVVRIEEKILARIRKSCSNPSRYEIVLFNSQNLDSRTRALLLFTSYFSVSGECYRCFSMPLISIFSTLHLLHNVHLGILHLQ